MTRIFAEAMTALCIRSHRNNWHHTWSMFSWEMYCHPSTSRSSATYHKLARSVCMTAEYCRLTVLCQLCQMHLCSKTLLATTSSMRLHGMRHAHADWNHDNGDMSQHCKNPANVFVQGLQMVTGSLDTGSTQQKTPVAIDRVSSDIAYCLRGHASCKLYFAATAQPAQPLTLWPWAWAQYCPDVACCEQHGKTIQNIPQRHQNLQLQQLQVPFSGSWWHHFEGAFWTSLRYYWKGWRHRKLRSRRHFKDVMVVRICLTMRKYSASQMHEQCGRSAAGISLKGGISLQRQRHVRSERG